MLNTIELTDDELETMLDALRFARENAVTNREQLRIRNVKTTILQQWGEDE